MIASARHAALAIAACLVLPGPGAAQADSPAWVQMTGSGAEVRLITQAPACPPMVVDGQSRASHERAGPSDAFPGRVCAMSLAAHDQNIVAEGVMLRAPPARIRRLVILGDSGCRMKGQAFQSCNDPGAWPFARIAALAAAARPDLVLHVGDYYYRETPCPITEKGCQGSPYGDRWPSWKAELFDPAAPLLTAAPWVFARGNHEDCKRGGVGWFRFLDAAAGVKACPADSDTFAVNLGGVRLYVVDSHDTDDINALSDSVGRFAARLGPVRRGPGGEPAWILTHRPIWNASRLGDLVADGVVNASERRAVKGRDLSGVDLILSGHVHNFSSLAFAGARPSQLVVGTSGDTLDLNSAPPPTSGRATVDGLTADIFSLGRYGYFVFDRQGHDWVGAFHDVRDAVAATCRLHARVLTCKAA